VAARLTSIAASPDGSRLAVADGTGTIHLLQVSSGQVLRRLSGHRHLVYALAWTPDGTGLLSAGLDRQIRLWRADDGAVTWVLPEPPAAEGWLGGAISRDGSLAALASDTGAVLLLRAADGAVLGTLPGHGSRVWSVVFSPDARLLASSSDDGTLRLWDPARLRPIDTLRVGHGGVMGLQFSPDGARIASGHADGTVVIWDARTRRKLALLGRARLEQSGGCAGLSDTPRDPTSTVLARACSLGPQRHLRHVLTRGRLARRGIDLVEDWSERPASPGVRREGGHP
jgi:WD40 repeat protein